MSEKAFKPEDGSKPGVLGTTFSCIVGRQFQKLKFGDRFFYTFVDEDKPVPGQFTTKQVHEKNLQIKAMPVFKYHYSQIDALKKRTLSGVLCDNVNDLKAVAKNAFEKESRAGDLISCTSFAAQDFKLDLTPFKDK